jgi:hypothetical protein
MIDTSLKVASNRFGYSSAGRYRSRYQVTKRES